VDFVVNGAAICFGLVALLFAAVIVYGSFSRRSESEPDPEGVRTLATFRGGPCGAEELERIAEEGPATAGADMLRALVEALVEEGVDAADPVSPDGYGWGVLLGEEGDAHLRVGVRSTGEIGEVFEDTDDMEWVLMLEETSAGGPGPRELLMPIHRALGRLPGVESIQWFPRHRFDEDEEAGGHPYPVDESRDPEG